MECRTILSHSPIYLLQGKIEIIKDFFLLIYKNDNVIKMETINNNFCIAIRHNLHTKKKKTLLNLENFVILVINQTCLIHFRF